MSTPNLWERAKEAMRDALAETVDAGVYPDGPCLDRDTRKDIRAVLAEMERVECVEGSADVYTSLTPRCGDTRAFFENPNEGERPALLLLEDR